MALIPRNVTATIKKSDGSLWADAEIRYSISDTQADGSIIVPKITVIARTNAQGVATAALYTLEGSYLNYDVTLPGGDSQTVSLPDADTDLSELWETAASADQIAIRIASTTEIGGVRIDGTTITIDENGVISSTGGGGGGAVDSVNGQTGVVVLDADDISDTSTTNKFVTAAEKTKLSNLSGTNSGDQDLSGYATKTGAETLTNKTLTAPVINSPTGIVKGDVGLGNVDNTSDANKPISSAQATVNTGLGTLIATKLAAASNLSDLTDVPTARTNLGFEPAVRATPLTGLGAGTNTAILATDTILAAFAKLQNQISNFAGAASPLSLNATADNQTPLKLKRFSDTHTANLLQILSQDNTVLGAWLPDGRINVQAGNFNAGAYSIMPTGVATAGIDFHASGIWGVFINNFRRLIVSDDGASIGALEQYAFNSQAGNNGAAQAGLATTDQSVVKITNGSTGGGGLQLQEMTAPAAPATNNVILYAVDNGSGKTKLMALFPTGAAQQISIEP